MNRIIVITGPTGVGKTRLSITLAKKYNAEIINADAMQVYKGLDIGTAKITNEEKCNIPHHLLDIKDVNEDYTIYDYQKDVRKILDKDNNKTYIMVGGSNLYIKAALYDYNLKDNIINNNYDDLSNEEIYQKLLLLDKDIVIDNKNRRRLIRALNYYLENNESINKNDNGNKLLYNAIFIGLTTNREKLYNIINSRVDTMINNGLINEVKYFYDNNMLYKPILNGIGYKEVISYLNKEIDYNTMIELIKKNSRHYAKRQYTFMNNKMNIKWFNVDFNNFKNTEEEVISYLEESI